MVEPKNEKTKKESTPVKAGKKEKDGKRSSKKDGDEVTLRKPDLMALARKKQQRDKQRREERERAKQAAREKKAAAAAAQQQQQMQPQQDLASVLAQKREKDNQMKGGATGEMELPVPSIDSPIKKEQKLPSRSPSPPLVLELEDKPLPEPTLVKIEIEPTAKKNLMPVVEKLMKRLTDLVDFERVPPPQPQPWHALKLRQMALKNDIAFSKYNMKEAQRKYEGVKERIKKLQELPNDPPG